MTAISGKIQTVLGLINPEDAGVTYTHEHLSITFDVSFKPPADDRGRRYENAPITMETLGWVQRYPYTSRPNLQLFEEQEAVVQEIKEFKANGGHSLVDNTTVGLKRDVGFVKSLAEKTGVNVILGTGFYVGAVHSDETRKKTVEQLAEFMADEILKGVEGTDVKCGAIGEIGCSWPLQDSEKKVLRATGSVQNSLKCPVIIHPGREYAALEEIVRIYQESGGDVNKCVMSHLDRTVPTDEKLLEFAELGAYCEYDLFGVEASLYQYNDFIMPGDLQRIERIKTLIREGYQDKICIAHDVHTKHRLTKYGGHGYSHILLNVVPWMKQRGISQDNIDKILIHNPAKWLTFA